MHPGLHPVAPKSAGNPRSSTSCSPLGFTMTASGDAGRPTALPFPRLHGCTLGSMRVSGVATPLAGKVAGNPRRMSFAEVAEALERSRAGERQEALASGDGVSGAGTASRSPKGVLAAGVGCSLCALLVRYWCAR